MIPLVSVIVVNHNGIVFVDACLRSILNSSYAELEIIFVDNASSDRSLKYVKDNFSLDKRLKFIENSGSLGPAVGRNMGARVSRGKYLVFFDNDTRVDNKCVAELVKVLENDHGVGAGQAKLLRIGTENLYDCAGDYLGPLGFLIERSRGAKDVGQFNSITNILSAKSAASIIRRDLFNKIGGFDEDFYMYLEETDLSWRVWLAGFKVVFIPSAVVHHAFNTPKKQIKDKYYYQRNIVRYYGCRNYISTLIKNLELPDLLKILPIHIGCWLLLSLLFLLKREPRDAFYILKGIGWNILNFDILLNKRRNIIREIAGYDILDKIMDKQRLHYYVGKAFAYLSGKAF
ncbi:glycosyltransferase family 2 protein [bacterium]|nr:MAG: glycosyltransferase family 2 protein [bacterium]